MKKILLFTLISSIIAIPQLQSISVAEFIQQGGMPQVVNGFLNLSNKNLTDLTGLQSIPNVDQVRVLNLSFNRLQQLPDDIFNGLNNLQRLFLSRNQLATLPAGIFNELNNLENLTLNNNQLTILPAGIFNGLNNLQSLILSYNQLTTLPTDIVNGLNNLQSLYLDNNKLTTLPDIFDRLNLKDLDISNNKLTKLPENIFDDLANLKRLSLRGNPFDPDFIPVLKDIIQNIPNLKYLNYKPKEQALKEVPFSTLFETAAEKIAQNIDVYRPRLHELSLDILEKLPLPEQEKAQLIAEKIGHNIDEYRDILHQLRQDIFDLLPFTPEQRARITAKKRRIG